MFQKSKTYFTVRTEAVLCALAFAVACQPAMAATLCVNPTGASGCQATIGAAVSAASSGDTIQVAAGTYKEEVTISKTLALIGAGSASTIIDATGLPDGINVDGSASAPMPGVSGVVVSGFTVENANFQGIIVQNASFVTIWNNQVIDNDKSLIVTGAARLAVLGWRRRFRPEKPSIAVKESISRAWIIPSFPTTSSSTMPVGFLSATTPARRVKTWSPEMW